MKRGDRASGGTVASAGAERSARPLLRVATYNIHSAIGTDGRYDPVRVAAVIAQIDADIVALQEVPLAGPAGRDGFVTVLEHLPGWHGIARLAAFVGDHGVGNAVLSRHPVQWRSDLDLSYPARETRLAVDADIRIGEAGHVRVIVAHFGLKPAERRHQADILLDAVRDADAPVLLMGDFNEWHRWGRALRRIVGHFEPVPMRRTFPSRWPVFALDRIWAWPMQCRVHVYVHRSELARRASDHLPLVAEFDLPFERPPMPA